MHKNAVSSIIGGTVWLCADIQILSAQGGIVGSGLHGIYGIDIVQSRTGRNNNSRINLNRENTIFPIDPISIGFHSQDKALRCFVEGEGNLGRKDSTVILHVRYRDLVDLLARGVCK